MNRSAVHLLSERIGDTTVSLGLLGTCTWSKRAVERELEAARAPSADGIPNGLLACTLDRNAKGRRCPSVSTAT